MKTPDEIKKGLELCSNGDMRECLKCPYPIGFECFENPMKDALAYIHQLEEGIDRAAQLVQSANELIKERLKEMESRLAHVERERDAAVEDLKGSSWCEDCRHYKAYAKKEPCKTCLKNNMKTLWQWRGVCPENTKEDDHVR